MSFSTEQIAEAPNEDFLQNICSEKQIKYCLEFSITRGWLKLSR